MENSENIENCEMAFCQCCAMPLDESGEFEGTEADGSKNEEYCIYCYKDGAFTAPDATMEEMIEICVPHMVANGGMAEDEARSMMQNFFPELKRWKK
jgi:hypothetical protein